MSTLRDLFAEVFIMSDEIETDPAKIIEASNIPALKEPIKAEDIYKVPTKSRLSTLKPFYSRTSKERQNNIETNSIERGSDQERE